VLIRKLSKPRMGRIDLNALEFAPAITAQWRDPDLSERLTGRTA